MDTINQYVFAIMGISIEALGGLYLALEAIGVHRFKKAYSIIYKFSKWSKKSIARTFVVAGFAPVLILYGFISNNEVILGLALPLILIQVLLAHLSDHPDMQEKWILIKTKEGNIGPVGFVLILIGKVFQLISIIWQVIINKG